LDEISRRFCFVLSLTTPLLIEVTPAAVTRGQLASKHYACEG
jgi:hypothetical protein